MNRTTIGCAATVFLGLLVCLNAGVLEYAFRTPGAFAPGAAAFFAGNVLLPLILAAGVCCGMRALGERLLTRLVGGDDRPSWRPILALALGAAAASSALFFVGSAGFFRPGVLRVLALGLIALGAADLLRLRGEPPAAAGRPWGAGEAAAAGFLAYAAWNSIVRALAPPTDVDVLKYHLALPKLYLGLGRVESIPWQMFSHWPQLMEMLYSLGLACGRDGASALLHAALCAALVLLTYRLARDEFGRPGALAAACLLAAQPILIQQAGAAMNDGALALFYLLSWACLRRSREGKDARWLRAAGLMAGAAASVKILGAVLAVGLAAWLAAGALRRRDAGGARRIGTFLCWAAVFAAPWYAKEWISSGNPVWPFLPRLFGGRWGGGSGALAAWVNIDGRGQLAWMFADNGVAFLVVPAVAALAYAARRRLRPFALGALVPALVYIPFVARSGAFFRYSFSFYPALALAAGWGFSRLSGEGRRLRAAGAGVLLFGLCGIGRARQNNALFPFLGLRSRLRPESSPRDAYLARSLPGYDFFRSFRRVLAPGDRVLLVTENRGYYLDADYMFGDPSEQAVIDYAAVSGPEELRDRLARAGVTHVAVNDDPDWAPALRSEAPRTYALIDETLRRFAAPALSEKGRTLYRLAPADFSARKR